MASTVTVTSCNPDVGIEAGGTPVTIGGTGFVATPTVTFGGVPATDVVFVGATSLTCVTPAGTGAVDVVVTNADTGAGTLVGGFTYVNATPTSSLDMGDERRLVQVAVEPRVVDVSVPAGSIIQGPDGALYYKAQATGVPADDVRLLASAPQFTVGPVGLAPYQTIQAAADAADASGLPLGEAVVYIMPGTYTEDLLFESYSPTIKALMPPYRNYNQTVTLVGTITLNNDTAITQGITMQNINVTPAAGNSPVVITGEDNQNCIFESCTMIADGVDVFDVSGMGAGYTTFSLNGGNYAIVQTTDRVLNTSKDVHLSVYGATVGTIGAYSADRTIIEFNNASANLGIYPGGRDGKTTATVFGKIVADNIQSVIIDRVGTWVNAFYATPTTGIEINVALNPPDHASTPSYIRRSSMGEDVITTISSGPIIGGTQASTLKEVPYASAGGVAQYDGANWRFNQLTAAQTDYLVGPAGTAKYTTIQSAIDQALADGMAPDDPKTVYVLPGTYTEDLTFHPGLYLQNVVVSTPASRVGTTGNEKPELVGKITFTNTLVNPPQGAFIDVQGFKITPTSGDSAFNVTSSTMAIVLCTFRNCTMTTDSADVIDAVKGTALFVNLSFVMCSMSATSGRVLRDVTGITTVFQTCYLASDGTRSIIVAGGNVSIYNDESGGVGDSARVTKAVEIEAATAGNKLALVGVSFDVTGDDVVVDGTLDTPSYFTKCLNTKTNAPITISGANAAQLLEAPVADSGDIKLYDGVRWQDAQLTAAQTDYLVGPTGTAKYTTIQAAVTQAVADGYDNDNPVDIRILPGTYVEDIAMEAGISLRAVDVLRTRLADSKQTVAIDGTLTCAKADAGATTYVYNIEGIQVVPTTGSTKPAITETGTARKSIGIRDCKLTTADADAFSFGGTSQYCGVAISNSIISVEGAGTYPATIPADYTISMSGSQVGSLWFSASGRAMRLNGGSFFFYGTWGQNSSLFGTVEVMATGAGSTLVVQHADWAVLLEPSQAIIGASLSNSFYFDATTSGNPITITGANASEFTERPTGDAGDVLTYNGQQWLPNQLVAAQTDFLVGPAGEAKYTTIQSAIDAASNGDTVYVLPGTYAESLTLKDGVNIKSVQPDLPTSAGVTQQSVIINGAMTWTPTGFTQIEMWGLDAENAAGTALAITADAGAIGIVKLVSCSFKGNDAPAAELGTTGTIVAVATVDTGFERGYSSVAGATLELDSSVQQIDMLRGWVSGSSGVPGIKVAVDLSGSATFKAQDMTYGNAVVGGQILVSGGTGNTLQLSNTRISPDAGDDHVVVTGTLDAESYFTNTTDGTQGNEGGDILITGANAATFIENPTGDAGDIRVYSGSRWESAQLAAAQTDYLVGPVGTAKYTTIQAAVTQAVADGYDNSNPVDIWILPGTYVEDIAMEAGISLRATSTLEGKMGNTRTEVKVDGTLTFAKTDAAATTYEYKITGIEIAPTTGSTKNCVVESGTARKLIQFSVSKFETKDADVVSFGGTAASANVSMTACGVVISGANTVVATIPADCTIGSSATQHATLWINAGANLFELDGGSLIVVGTPGQNTGLLGSVEVLGTGAGSSLIVKDVDWDLVVQSSQAIIGASISASSYFSNAYSGGSPITITGANASEFVERPPGDAGDVLTYNGQQWLPNQLLAEQVEFLVGPAGTAKYTTIQAAVTQAVADGYDNSNPVDIWILPGTYVEDIAMEAGITLRAVSRLDERTADARAEVLVDGTLTFAKVDAGSTLYRYNLYGIQAYPTVGATKPALEESGTAKKSITLYSCDVRTADADVIVFEGTSQSASVTAVNSVLSTSTNGGTVAEIPADCTLSCSGSQVASLWFDAAARSVKLDGGSFAFYGTYGQNNAILGTIEVLATGAGSSLKVANTDSWNVLLNPSHAIIGASISSSYFYDASESRSPITITGANASEFTERPPGVQQTIYVGKHGNDDWSGNKPERAKLTIAAAITAAGTPASEAAAVTVEVVDDGAYSENLTGVAYVNINAPNATLVNPSANNTIADNSTWRFRRITPTADSVCTKSAGSGVARLVCEYVDVPNASVTAINCSSGSIDIDVGRLTCASSGSGVGASGGGAVRGRIGIIDGSTSIGAGAQSSENGTVQLRIGSIINGGTGFTGLRVVVLNADGYLYADVDLIETPVGIASVQLTSGAQYIYARVGRIDCTTAYNMAASGTLRLIAGDLSGTETAAAGADVRVTVARKDNYAATTDPTATDDSSDGYTVGSVWVNVTTDKTWTCVDATATSAIWSAGGSDVVAMFDGDSSDFPVSNWAVNVGAPVSADSNDADMSVCLFDGTTEEGRGFKLFVPAGKTKAVIKLIHRRESGTSTPNNVQPRFYSKRIGKNLAPSSWSSGYNLDTEAMRADENWIYSDSSEITLSTLGITTTDESYMLELTRYNTAVTNNMTDDWTLWAWGIKLL